MKKPLKQYEEEFFYVPREAQEDRVIKNMSKLCGLSEDHCKLISQGVRESFLFFLNNPHLCNANGVNLIGGIRFRPKADKMRKHLVALDKPKNFKMRARYGDNYTQYFKTLKLFYGQAKSKRSIYDHVGNGTEAPEKRRRAVASKRTGEYRVWYI